MGKPAARIMDMHVCPMVDVLKPHVGGPVTGPGVPTVLIGGMPAAVMGDMCTCVGPPDVIILGSAGVMIGGKPAARMGDMTAHGGTIVIGCPTVLIGEAGGGGGGGAGGAGNLNANAMKDALNKKALTDAAGDGDGLAPKTNKEDLKAQFTLVDEAQKPIKGVEYEIETSDGAKHKGKTDAEGKTANISGVTPADCRVSFFNT
jgi:uncharacterized Zn-binding protein involved in type VI secretion